MDIEKLLEKIQKPARYIGGEWNSVRKDLDAARVRVALCFPDVYEIGMSHLGFKILYHLLNEQPGVVCERVFTPWHDMQDVLRREGVPLYSLESKRPLADFDIIGFSVAHELNYTNVLSMLSLAGIPLKAGERRDDFPIVIAGGVSCFNPEPMAEFFDAFFLGEAEEGILEIISKIKYQKSKSQSKNQILKELCGIEGVYVPSFYEVRYNEDGTIKSFAPKEDCAPAVIKKRIVKDFDGAYYPTRQIVPYIQIVHDRISLEVMRGCPNRCFFCSASSVYWPRRQRSLDRILQLAEEAYHATGYEEISLVSLSTGDHTQIMDIVKNLIDRFKPKNVSISLPSLRPEDMLLGLPQLISSVKKTGLTFSLEAGSQRLRGYINKRIDFGKLYSCITEAGKYGWRHVKIYFMIGLPTEEEEDLFAMADLVRKISKADSDIGKPLIAVNVSVSFFVPKPHTRFERLAMADTDTITKRQAFLQKTLKAKGVVLKWHDAKLSFLEGVLSRGDRRLSAAILKAHQLGAGFDGWRECFNLDRWQRAFQESGINPDFYLYRERRTDEILPWSHIDCGLPKQKLY
jgi:radical SAM family uncharacterized protein